MEDLLERPVGVTQPAGVLTGVDSARRTVAGGPYEAVSRRPCVRGRGGGGELAGGGEVVEIWKLARAWVQPLP